MSYQPKLLNLEVPAYPGTRYQGSKNKIVDWIWEQTAFLDFRSVLDAFGGTGVVGYKYKGQEKEVTYNDLLKFNYYGGVALIQNNETLVTDADLKGILKRKNKQYGNIIQKHFTDVYFTDEENEWLDYVVQNIQEMENPYKKAIAYYAVFQACIIKRPYNLFHRKNLYIRTADVKRSFGNKVTWDKPFEQYFKKFVFEANQAVFDNGHRNMAMNTNVMEIKEDYDLVYIDTPYISQKGNSFDYRDFYHFLEGITFYESWEEKIDYKSKHKRLVPENSDWNNKNKITAAFDALFEKFAKSILVVSYRSDGIPSENEIFAMLSKHKKNVQTKRYGKFKYVLSKNNESEELLFIAY